MLPPQSTRMGNPSFRKKPSRSGPTTPPPPRGTNAEDFDDLPDTSLRSPSSHGEAHCIDSRNESRESDQTRTVVVFPSNPASSPQPGSDKPLSRNARDRRRMRDKIQRLLESEAIFESRLERKSALLKLEMEKSRAMERKIELLEARLKEQNRPQNGSAHFAEPQEDVRALTNEVKLLRTELNEKNQALRVSELTMDDLNRGWAADKLELQKLQGSAEMLKKLQQEVLAGVDRHEPTFDEKIHSRFITINGKLNSVVRATGKGLSLFTMFASKPFDTWTIEALPKHSYNKHSTLASTDDKRAVKLLMRLAIWNHIRKKLFSSSEPFAVYGATMARNLNEDYLDMFGQDNEMSETAAKWRAMTAHRLAELDNQGYQDRVLDSLIESFARVVYDDIGYQEKPEEEIIALFRGDLLPKLEPVFRAAMDLAQVISKERAGYSLVIPNLRELSYKKVEDDGQLTNRARLPNIDVAANDEEETGTIALIASPMLLKWGTGRGEELECRTVLEKAFVIMEPYSLKEALERRLDIAGDY